MLIRTESNHLLSFIERKEKNKPVLIVQGARQVGKTFLIENLLKSKINYNVTSFNLEKDVLIRDQIDQCNDFSEFTLLMNSKGLRDQESNILFIDEAQESLKLGSFIRAMKEDWKNLTVVVSGSSITKLFKQNNRVPVGRIEYLRISPLSYEEFCYAANKGDLFFAAKQANWNIPETMHEELLKIYDQYLEVGGMPKVVNAYINGASYAEFKNLRLEIYISQRDDFQRKENKLKPHLFTDGTKAICSLIGFPFSLNRISQNHRDAKATLNILNEWLIAHECEQKTSSSTSIAHSKVYFYDLGIIRDLRDTVIPSLSVINYQAGELRTALGGLIENAIYLSFQSGKGFLNELSGWRKSKDPDLEVDFIYNQGTLTIPIEVKTTNKISNKHFKSILAYLNITKQRLGILVSTAKFQKIIIDDFVIYNLPIYACSREVIEAHALSDRS